MSVYPVKTPKIVPRIFKKYHWKIPNANNEVFLTFDDGPTPEITEFVLEILNKHNIKAGFFVVGNQAKQYPELLQKIFNEGHSIGNHTFTHLHGWKHLYKKYLHEIIRTHNLLREILHTNIRFFRPPYGKFSYFVRNHLLMNYEVIMWDILVGDFDKNCSPEKCVKNVTKNLENGSIIVLHDSLKCKQKLKEVLEPIILEIKKQNYNFGNLKCYFS